MKTKRMTAKQKLDYIRTATELGYSFEAVKKLLAVSTDIQADRIMNDARNGRI